MTLVAVEDVARPPSADVLAQRIDALEDTQRDSSRRLHIEIADLERRIRDMQSRPVEVDKIRFPPRVVAAIVVGALAILGSMYLIRSDVADIKASIAKRDEIDVLQRKLSEQQIEGFGKKIDDFDKRQQLQAIQFQELKEMVLKQGVSK